MKLIFSILLIILTFQSFSKANNIKEIELDGMSLGNSLLNFYSKKK